MRDDEIRAMRDVLDQHAKVLEQLVNALQLVESRLKKVETTACDAFSASFPQGYGR